MVTINDQVALLNDAAKVPVEIDTEAVAKAVAFATYNAVYDEAVKDAAEVTVEGAARALAVAVALAAYNAVYDEAEAAAAAPPGGEIPK